MDICVLNQFFYPYSGGTEKVLLEVYKRLAKRNNVTVITSAEPGAGSSKEEIAGIEVVRLRSSYVDIPAAPLPFVSMGGLNGAIANAHCELYHINNRYQYFYGNVAAIRRAGGKMALTIHNALPTGIGLAIDAAGHVYDLAWGRALMHNADVITGISRNAIETTVPRGELKKTHLVYNGVDYRLFKPSGEGVRGIERELGGGFGSNDANVITNGRLTPQKGQVYLIDAIGKLAKEGRRLGLVMIGRGPLEHSLRSHAESLGLRGRFWVKTGIGEKRLPHYYNACDIFAMPSLYEPAGVAALEALACELPAVVSDVGGLPETIGGCGLLARPKDADDMKGKILYALDNGKKMRSLARRGRRLAIEKHDWDKIARQYEGLFLNTLRY